jgi:hypothetical protein
MEVNICLLNFNISSKIKVFITRQLTTTEWCVSYSPRQNGITERMNRTLQEAVLSMILHAGVSNNFWAEAVCSAAYIRKQVITTTTGGGGLPV